MKTGQKVNSLPDVQLPMQNCTNVQCFVVDAAHGLKAYQVYFPTQPTAHLLDFPRWSYWQNTEDCTEDQWPRGNNSELISWRPFRIVYIIFFFPCLHLSRRAVPSINTPLLHSILRLLIIEIQKPPLFSCVLTNLESDLYPFALVISFAGFIEAVASSAPNWCSYSLRGFLDWL